MSKGKNWRTEFEKKFFYAENDEDVEQARKMKEEHFPKKLYKYCSFDTLTGKIDELVYTVNQNKPIINLVSGALWLSKPENFNDPYDCSINFFGKERFQNLLSSNTELAISKVVEDIKNFSGQNLFFSSEEIKNLKKSRNKSNMLQKLINEKTKAEGFRQLNINSLYQSQKKFVLDSYEKEFKSKCAVNCLSENKASILMWSHYASDHKGFCIEYDFTNDDRKELFYPVIYSKDIFIPENSNNLMYGSFLNITPNMIRHAALRKAKEWSYENEWRIVDICRDTIKGKGEKIPAPLPTAIFLGCKISPINEKILRDTAEQLSIPVKKAVMETDKFKLNYK